METPMKLASLTLAAAFAALSCAATAEPLAGFDRAPARMVIPTSDLDLSHTPGAQALLGRIARISAQTCGSGPDLRSIRENAAFAVCVQSNMDAAVRAVNAPLVTALHEGRTPDARLAAR
jgi:UrcA family protein